MLRRLYVHNYRCLENFEWRPRQAGSSLLIGPNGSGKSTIRKALEVLQSIARGQAQLRRNDAPQPAIEPRDFAHGRTNVPISFEIEVGLHDQAFVYRLALELPPDFRDLRVREESLSVDGSVIFRRDRADVTLSRKTSSVVGESTFSMDWHQVALPFIQERQSPSAIATFRQWLARLVLLDPIPQDFKPTTKGELRDGIDLHAKLIATWLASTLRLRPAGYIVASQFLKEVMPEFESIRFDPVGGGEGEFVIALQQDDSIREFKLDQLSEGEKCFILAAAVLAAYDREPSLAVFWDQLDSHLALPEIDQFVLALKRAARKSGGQLIATSHHPQAIESFGMDETWLVGRETRFRPTAIRNLSELSIASGERLTDRLIEGSVTPWAA